MSKAANLGDGAAGGALDRIRMTGERMARFSQLSCQRLRDQADAGEPLPKVVVQLVTDTPPLLLRGRCDEALQVPLALNLHAQVRRARGDLGLQRGVGGGEDLVEPLVGDQRKSERDGEQAKKP